MSANLFLTDESSDVSGYYRARLTSPSDATSLVQAVTTTVAGPTAGIQATRTAGVEALAWITDPLTAVNLTAAAWTLHLWAKESVATANAAVRFQVLKWAGSEGATALDDNQGTELTTTMADITLTTGGASVTTMAAGNRLVFKVLFDDAGVMGAGTATLSYNGQFPFAEGYSYVTCPDTLAASAAIPAATTLAVRQAIADVGSDASYTNAFVTAGQITQSITAAIARYSNDRPFVAVQLYNGDGTTVNYRLPSKWLLGFSRINEIEYPVSTTMQLRVIMDREEYEILDTAVNGIPQRYIRWTALVPETGTGNVALRYTTRHTHTDQLDTIYPDDFSAFVWLAGSYAAEIAAAHRASSQAPLLGVDSVDHQQGADKWSTVAKRLRALYDQHMGNKPDSQAAAGFFLDWDPRLLTGERRLFEGRRIR